MIKYIFFGVVVAAILSFVIFMIIRNNKIRKNGIETDAVISRIEESESIDSEGGVDVSYTHYVTYRTPDGQEVEAVLNHVSRRTYVGDLVRIKYLPEKPNYALLVKKNN